jgi:hypothetical protein
LFIPEPAERYFEASDAGRAALRTAVSEVEQQIAHLQNARAGADRGLAASWAALVKLLALGPAHQLRECPSCGQLGMRDATRCGHCWERLPAVASVTEAAEVAGGGADS